MECGFPVAAHLSVGCIRILLVLVVDGVECSRIGIGIGLSINCQSGFAVINLQ